VPERRQAIAVRAAGALPAVLAKAIARREGAPLEPDLQVLLRVIARLRWPALESMPVLAAQRESRRESTVLAGRRVPAAVRTLAIPSGSGTLAARLYVPPGAARHGALLVWLHGGGWVLGDLESHDPLCRRLARDAGVRVLAVDYRVAPAARFPAAVDDALAAVGWALAHAREIGADPARVGVGGDSAGGNLAAVAALALREALAFQVLLYPITDVSREHPSYEDFADGPWLTAALMRWFRALYVPDEQAAADPRASPLRASDPAGAPPAYVGLAGIDPLLDEGRAYARLLAAAGVPVRLQQFPRQLHGYAELAGVSRSARAATAAATAWISHQ